ncbi:MAG: type II toxin-antitoxin system VapC family toxin [Elainellaceae cyanobacterium]
MPQMILLDTHIWFWLITQEFERFPKGWRDIIETAPTVGISVISCYEIALARDKGRLELPCPTNQWLEAALEPSGISLLPLTPEIACAAVALSPIHKDPFDRVIIATAIAQDAKLASVDGLFRRYPELTAYLLD